MKIFIATIFCYLFISWATEVWLMHSYAGCTGTMRPCAEQGDIVVSSLAWPFLWYVESALLEEGKK